MAKRLLCVLLSVLMVVAMLPTGVVADSTSTTFTFSNVTVTARYDSTTTYPASNDGSLSWTFTSNYSEIWFKLPSTVSGTVTSVTLNDVVMSSGSTSDLCVKVYGDGTAVKTAYNSSSATLSESEIATMSTASTVNIGIMSNLYDTSTDVSGGVTVTIGSVTVTTETTTSGGTTETYYLISDGTSVAGSTFNSGTISFGSTIVTSSDTTFMDMVTRDDAVITIEYTVTDNDSNGGYWNIFQFASSGDADNNDWISITSYSGASYGASTMTDTLNGTVVGNQWSLITTGSHVVTYSAANLIAYYNANKSDCTFEDDFTELKSQSGLSSGEISITNMYITASASSTTPTLYGKTLTLDGSIGVTYYFDMGELDASDYTLKGTLSYDGNSTDVAVSASEYTVTIGSTEYTSYTVPVTIANFLGTIDVDLVDSNSDVVVSLDDYSASNYCTNMANNTNVGDLCKALVTYAYYADVAVNGNDGSLITGYENMSSYTGASSLTASASDGVTKTLVLGDTIYIRVYVDDASATYTVSGKTLTSGSDTTGSYIEFPVAAKQMATEFTVLKDGSDYTTYSVNDYVANQLSSSSTATNAVKNLCKAVYYYGQAASAYSSWI